MGFFAKIKEGLQKTKENITHRVELVINSFTKIDEDFFEELDAEPGCCARRNVCCAV